MTAYKLPGAIYNAAKTLKEDLAGFNCVGTTEAALKAEDAAAFVSTSVVMPLSQSLSSATGEIAAYREKALKALGVFSQEAVIEVLVP